MDKSVFDDIRDRLHTTQREMETEIERLLEEQRKRFRYQIQRGKVVFEREISRLQRRHRVGLWHYLSKASIAYILSAPIIYGMIVPLAFLDLSVTLYQHICFRIYGIPRVRHADYLVIDRHHLAYLNAIEKFNCVYCGYGNGVLAYAREVAARTEQFWCPIKHARRTLHPHSRSGQFFDYGDAEAYRSGLPKIRRDWET